MTRELLGARHAGRPEIGGHRGLSALALGAQATAEIAPVGGRWGRALGRDSDLAR
jgi:hypothetical protein